MEMHSTIHLPHPTSPDICHRNPLEVDGICFQAEDKASNECNWNGNPRQSPTLPGNDVQKMCMNWPALRERIHSDDFYDGFLRGVSLSNWCLKHSM